MKENKWNGECDGLGCNTACCKGCSCCMERKAIIEEKDKEIDKLKIEVLKLMARPTSFSSDEQLRKEKEELSISLIDANKTITRLREERNGYYQLWKKLYEENKKLKECMIELEKIVDILEEQLSTTKKEVKELRTKTKSLVQLSQECQQETKMLVKK